jgi:hypothetical protein
MVAKSWWQKRIQSRNQREAISTVSSQFHDFASHDFALPSAWNP